ncbi:Fic/DOC family protein [Umezawaea endophytica]|uniref:protein adenylyltransferase n=1 Tax=Umezawaea endophytica TaxID=1654476 RepID=A0A9X3ALE2_9PSEU|nr:Fic family protein [Umezawaea endophytica]MCS7484290.1 Fic family protein [Umezawaea endophytica]
MTAEDPYLDPGSKVLINKLGVVDAVLLRQVEAEATFLRDAQLKAVTLPGRFDLAHLRAFHRHLFGDVYPWAGEVRRVDLTRTATFAHWAHIESYAADVFGRLRAEHHLATEDDEGFLDRFTYFYAEVNALHPFREGNGRAQRAFFRQLALHAGRRIDFGLLDPASYNEACRISMAGSTDPLRGLFREALVPGAYG